MKPMLACSTIPPKYDFPLYASFKVDGVRCYVKDGKATSRSGKSFANKHIQRVLSNPLLEGLDGEIAAGRRTAPNLMQLTTSAILDIHSVREFEFVVFDIWHFGSHTPFSTRYEKLRQGFADLSWRLAIPFQVQFLEQRIIHNQEELDAFEALATGLGYEGVICKSITGGYKFNRATEREATMWKLKRFIDGEARIVGYKEEMHNANEATIDDLGHTARSSHKANKIPKGTLGAFVCEDVVTKQAVDIGTGYTAAQRLEYWTNRDNYIGKIVKYKHFPHGVKDAPRHPTFISFRASEDM